MENYIKNHRKLSATICIVVILLLFGAVYALSSSHKPTTTSTDPNAQTGDADTSQTVQYSNSIYSITQDPSNPQDVSIKAYAGYRNAAVNKLHELGLNPTDYKITFNYESPFKNYE
jgi:hypothetical protein